MPVILATTLHAGGPETAVFWILAPFAVLASLGMVLSRNTVHGALLLGSVMLSLAVFYAAQDAPFLAFVQVIVYTGAVMMLFLFVLMLVGVDTRDSLIETLRGQRLAAAVAGIGFLLLLFAGIRQAAITSSAGIAEAPNGQGCAGQRRCRARATSSTSPGCCSPVTSLRSKSPVPCSSRRRSERWCSRTASGTSPAQPAGADARSVQGRHAPDAVARSRCVRPAQRRRHACVAT